MLGRLLGWSKTKPAEEPVGWEFSLTGEAPTLKMTILQNSRAAAFAQVIQAWTEDPNFRLAFSATLENCPFSAFRWELPRLTTALANGPFECVIVDSPSLLVPADPGAFSAQYTNEAEVVAFPNLGGDAALVVPCPLDSETRYGHLRAFLRTAPESQKHLLWQTVGTEMNRRLSAKPVWLNTAGGGVPWLHIRLDDQPKYYRHDPYR
jgi:hypothetical protein